MPRRHRVATFRTGPPGTAECGTTHSCQRQRLAVPRGTLSASSLPWRSPSLRPSICRRRDRQAPEVAVERGRANETWCNNQLTALSAPRLRLTAGRARVLSRRGARPRPAAPPVDKPRREEGPRGARGPADRALPDEPQGKGPRFSFFPLQLTSRTSGAVKLTATSPSASAQTLSRLSFPSSTPLQGCQIKRESQAKYTMCCEGVECAPARVPNGAPVAPHPAVLPHG